MFFYKISKYTINTYIGIGLSRNTSKKAAETTQQQERNQRLEVLHYFLIEMYLFILVNTTAEHQLKF